MTQILIGGVSQHSVNADLV